jgi:hypothetical protein
MSKETKFIATHDCHNTVYVGFKDRDEQWVSEGIGEHTWMYNDNGEKWGYADDVDAFIPAKCTVVSFADDDVQEADNRERWGRD